MKASQAEHTIIPSWSQLVGAQLPSSLVFLSRGISGTRLVSLTWWQSSTRSETKPSIMRFTVSLCWHGCVVELFFNPDINSLLISFALIKKSMIKSSVMQNSDQKSSQHFFTNGCMYLFHQLPVFFIFWYRRRQTHLKEGMVNVHMLCPRVITLCYVQGLLACVSSVYTFIQYLISSFTHVQPSIKCWLPIEHCLGEVCKSCLCFLCSISFIPRPSSCYVAV